MIESDSIKPPKLGKDVFKGLYKTVNGAPSLKHITLTVKKEAVEAYSKADTWKDFNIKEKLGFEEIYVPPEHVVFDDPRLWIIHEFLNKTEILKILGKKEIAFDRAQIRSALTMLNTKIRSMTAKEIKSAQKWINGLVSITKDFSPQNVQTPAVKDTAAGKINASAKTVKYSAKEKAVVKTAAVKTKANAVK
jgi:hypothetical protein